jgi:hypothetical protein
MPAFVEAVGEALAAREFILIEGAGHARLVADLSLSRTDVGATTTKVARARPAIVPGGYSSRAGASLNFALPKGESKTVPLQQTRLDISIKRRGEDDVMWHGSAITVRPADTAEGREDKVASDLSAAIFRGYPTQSETVISVP